MVLGHVGWGVVALSLSPVGLVVHGPLAWGLTGCHIVKDHIAVGIVTGRHSTAVGMLTRRHCGLQEWYQLQESSIYDPK